jgi:hypothetical protein
MSPSSPWTARFSRQRRPVSSVFLDAVDGEFGGGILLVLRDEARGLDEHTARAARGVEDAPVIGFDDFGEEADDAAGGVELAAALALAHGELAEEVFVDAPEGVVVHDWRESRKPSSAVP